MFSDAFAAAGAYTRPVIMSRKTIAGECALSIGACVILNPAGWVLTAFHIMKDWAAVTAACQQTKKIQVDRATIENDANLSNSAKKRALADLPRLSPKSLEECSIWWGNDGIGTNPVTWQGIEVVDIAVAKLDPFDPAWCTHYPELKDPARPCTLGTSLARLGFPFISLKPTWDTVGGRFNLPLADGPPPLFMNEGIFSRKIAIRVAEGAEVPPVPLSWIETSNPGIKGQSGGPIFDKNGRLWGIQSNTYSYPLDFEPSIPNRNPPQKEYQFLNVGRGVHVETIVPLLNQLGIDFSLGNY